MSIVTAVLLISCFPILTVLAIVYVRSLVGFIVILAGIITMVFVVAAHATTCSQANSECEAKGLTNIIIGAPSNAASEAKGLVNVITNNGNESAAKLLVNIILIPGTATGPLLVPASPLPTHFR